MGVSSRVLSLLVLCIIQLAAAEEKPTEDGGCDMEETCDFNDCKDGEECVVMDGEAMCRPCTSTCDGVECPEGQECILEVVQCFVPPCCPIPTCTPTDNSDGRPEDEELTCDGIECGGQEECVILDGIPTCIPELTCATINCITGYICVDRKCILDPCIGFQCPSDEECVLEVVPRTDPPLKVPSCKPIDRCAVIRCKEGTTCRDGECIEELTCDNVKCATGLKCYIEEIPCLVPPCPRRPFCRPDKCSDPCPEGDLLVDGECVTVPTCRGFECPPGEECFLEEVVCVKAPCLPIPSCRPKMCSSSFPCDDDSMCINGRCVVATCEDYECPPRQECYLRESFCEEPPCPPVPYCRPIPDCDIIHCAPGYLCYEGRCIRGPTCVG